MRFSIAFLFLTIIFGIDAQIRICSPECTSPQLCDTNTGMCRTFRYAFNGPLTIKCETSSCPSGTSCDTNTGICRSFRISGQ